jgi:membrane protein required for colicin V production
VYILDIVFIIIILVFIGIGIKRGLIGEVVRLSAMIVGVFVAFMYYNDLAKLFPKISIPLFVISALSFIIIYIGCALGVIAIGWGVKKLVHLTLLGWMDRLLGSIIGALKALLIVWVVCLSVSSVPNANLQQKCRNSYFYRAYKVLPASLSLKKLLSFRSRIRTFLP